MGKYRFKREMYYTDKCREAVDWSPSDRYRDLIVNSDDKKRNDDCYYIKLKKQLSGKKCTYLNLSEGKTVEHSKYGRGTVISLDNGNVLIHFDSDKTVKLQIRTCALNGLLQVV